MWNVARNNQRSNAAQKREGNFSKSTVKEHLRLHQAAPEQMLLQVLSLESRQEDSTYL